MNGFYSPLTNCQNLTDKIQKITYIFQKITYLKKYSPAEKSGLDGQEFMTEAAMQATAAVAVFTLQLD